jgi:hypothetical protein
VKKLIGTGRDWKDEQELVGIIREEGGIIWDGRHD